MDDLPPGTRLRLEYGDHNEAFADELPRAATVLCRVRTANVDDWYLVDLDEPVRSDGISYDRLLIRSRELGSSLGGPRPVSVFILLVPDGSGVPADGFDPRAFIHVAWGTATAPADAD
jgi:hypothetical protein